ncbi:hypothetical protein LSCM1_05602 [Leishmania martiniquensis]|uniref:MSP domain-containing protein n=1 Tax=Leishmania martiniquensis TaxID=1580590 RepID=A0A836HHV6_9TRYP|nr:hypothetical protein LSCM1_05602 [Leishmania martiniquensis]
MASHHSLVNTSASEGAANSPLVARQHSASHPQRHRSSKKHAQIKIEPTCLVFPPPHFGRCIQNAISIYNVSKQPCVFKMRSQNPERYVAKPHVAIMAPESATRSFVTLRDMNTMGMKNLPESTQDRFRFSLKLYDPTTVDPSLSPKDLWNLLAARGQKVDHEQDLIAYFTKRDTPVGGLVTFFPPTYITSIPSAVANAALPPTSATAATGAPGGDSAGRLTPDGAKNTVAERSKAGGGAVAKCAAYIGAAKGTAARRELWVVLVVAAVMVLSVSVVTSRIWGAGDTVARHVEATASPGGPFPQRPAKQAHRVAPRVSAELPRHHGRLAQHDGPPAAEPVQMQRPQQPYEGHHNSRPDVASPVVESPGGHHESPPTHKEAHHHHEH